MQVVALQVQYSSNNCCNQNYKVNPSIPKLQGRYLIWGSEETQPGEHDGAWSERIHWKHLGLQATTTNKSVFTLLEWLETRHCSPLLLTTFAADRRAAVAPTVQQCNRSFRAHSSKPATHCCSADSWDVQTNGRTPYRYTDPDNTTITRLNIVSNHCIMCFQYFDVAWAACSLAVSLCIVSHQIVW